ncbi:antichymotrypsin-2-like [Sabethes cyaneus]|uniref:antichymotrypsin-2-like n=1 Tax=Sabethes cyaneus TaxID=53552 RepID=UPI00237DC076|nr:antichymotrypsin-2-like [Sabethes cyaneus]
MVRERGAIIGMLIRAIPLILWSFSAGAAAAGAEGPDFSYGDAHFSIEYFKAAYNASKNCAVSPLSVRLAMAAFLQAADSSSFEETLQRAFYLPQQKTLASENAASFLNEVSEMRQLQIAYKVLKNSDPLTDEFAAVLEKVFKTSPEEIQFSEKSLLLNSANGWGNKVTNGLIRNFLYDSSLDPRSEMAILNSVSLRASWAEKFSPAMTDRQIFTFRDGTRNVQMMHKTIEVLYKADSTYQTVQIPYSEESDLSMWLLMPASGAGSFKSLMAALTDDLLEEIETTAVPTVVDISLPRFEIQTVHTVRKVIEKLGYGQLYRANELSLFKAHKSTLGEMVQGALLKVDEEGTDSTVAQPITAQDRTENTRFNANQPFIFIVKKISTDTIVLIGHYSNYY